MVWWLLLVLETPVFVKEITVEVGTVIVHSVRLRSNDVIGSVSPLSPTASSSSFLPAKQSVHHCVLSRPVRLVQ